LDVLLKEENAFFNECMNFSSTIARVHQLYSSSDYWRVEDSGSDIPQLLQPEAANSYYGKMYHIHNVFRQSYHDLIQEHSLLPMKEAISRITPEIEELVKERNTQLVDYNANRRRALTLKEKETHLENSGRGNTPQALEIYQDRTKVEFKERHAKKVFDEKNKYTKEEMIRARQEHDQLIQDLFITNIVCQVRKQFSLCLFLFPFVMFCLFSCYCTLFPVLLLLFRLNFLHVLQKI
jgi:hypothetical protein